MRRTRERGALSANATLGIGLVGCVALVLLATVGTSFLRNPPPPRPAQKPAVTAEVGAPAGLKFSEGYYKATVEENAKALKLPTPSYDSMAAPLAYYDELPTPKVMKPEHDQLDTAHLHIETNVVKEWSTTGSAQRLRVEHIMMTITNKTNRPLAYRVDTSLPDETRCRSKGVLIQNAIALRPNETVTRTECFWWKRAALTVNAIQVLELGDLGYYYVSRLTPGQVLLDERSTAGHEPPAKLKTCTFVPWREIKAASEAQGGVTWGDVLDFYARHNCDEWSYFTSYRRWTTPGLLPARPGDGAATQPLEPTAKSR